MQNKINWIFFGTSEISVVALDTFKSKGFLPTLIITSEDRPKGRKLVLTPPHTKVWAENNKIPYLQLKTLKNVESFEQIKQYAGNDVTLSIVASYGKMIPKNILDLPKNGTLNIHPSLLPKLRGPSPIQSAILSEKQTGVTIIKLDEEMDHGPILTQSVLDEWTMDTLPYADELEANLGKIGAEILLEVLPDYLSDKLVPEEQDHSKATICQKITKQEGEIHLEEYPEKNLRKIRAFSGWPSAYFFDKNNNNTRVIVKTAHIKNEALVLDTVLPENKKIMSYSEYLRGIN